ncbi:hypothetical protein U14_03179 [Candidatus Moduliflexus flocculans]|uniref:Uncharacterized protein n=1 Tax=Candidatus Moduliflexus flocculans TaxID=1499966 RepID=A0A081BNG7_9BACT|nr:hypothetical protein U14_03179 [Candidatus Moduliflexus flocculans]
MLNRYGQASRRNRIIDGDADDAGLSGVACAILVEIEADHALDDALFVDRGFQHDEIGDGGFGDAAGNDDDFDNRLIVERTIWFGQGLRINPDDVRARFHIFEAVIAIFVGDGGFDVAADIDGHARNRNVRALIILSIGIAIIIDAAFGHADQLELACLIFRQQQRFRHPQCHADAQRFGGQLVKQHDLFVIRRFAGQFRGDFGERVACFHHIDAGVLFRRRRRGGRRFRRHCRNWHRRPLLGGGRGGFWRRKDDCFSLVHQRPCHGSGFARGKHQRLAQFDARTVAGRQRLRQEMERIGGGGDGRKCGLPIGVGHPFERFAIGQADGDIGNPRFIGVLSAVFVQIVECDGADFARFQFHADIDGFMSIRLELREEKGVGGQDKLLRQRGFFDHNRMRA